MDIFLPNFVPKVLNNIGLPFTPESQNLLNARPLGTKKFVKSLLKEMRVATNLLYRMIDDQTNAEYMNAEWNMQTRRHKTIQGEKWLSQQGFLYIVQLIIKNPDFREIKERDARKFYNECIRKMPYRLVWNPVTPEHYYKKILWINIVMSKQ